MITALLVLMLVGFALLYANYGKNKSYTTVGFLFVLLAWIMAIFKYFNLI